MYLICFSSWLLLACVLLYWVWIFRRYCPSVFKVVMLFLR
ncbi:DUF2644 domain-containing protein [Pseudoalteromonas sp. CR1]|nr:DUF2644 domain-containing protein [Pseudoalteromonas sp. CR1]